MIGEKHFSFRSRFPIVTWLVSCVRSCEPVSTQRWSTSAVMKVSIWRGTRPGDDWSGLGRGASMAPSPQTWGLTAEAVWEGALHLISWVPPAMLPWLSLTLKRGDKALSKPAAVGGLEALCSGRSLRRAVLTESFPLPCPALPGAGASLTIHSRLACAGQAGGPRSPRTSPRKTQVLTSGSPSVHAPVGGCGALGAQQRGSPPRYISVQFSHSVVSDSLRPHELQYTRPPCPSPTPGVYPNSCP